ncbi:MAG: hypothetical protein [Wendovervirus sonii]|uniref:Uncharacterized protein n=1 Tax=phage Lak_Megaphage_Sonny TaxID=3109229 RepID=A0ABZ0Z548_9CAUD|nr:MAG: hypothetical protein [phage Lak_Megaphage_Sonny]
MERPEISYRTALFDVIHNYTKDDLKAFKNNWVNYIDSKYVIGYSEENTCTSFPSGGLRHFGIHPKLANMYGEKPENILKCKVTIIEDHVCLKDLFKCPEYDENSTDYFGWIPYDNEDDHIHGISLIRSNIKTFSMQFPGGGDIEAKDKSGKIVRLKVELI